MEQNVILQNEGYAKLHLHWSNFRPQSCKEAGKQWSECSCWREPHHSLQSLQERFWRQLSTPRSTSGVSTTSPLWRWTLFPEQGSCSPVAALHQDTLCTCSLAQPCVFFCSNSTCSSVQCLHPLTCPPEKQGYAC